jgi:hypothetical protein
MLQALVPEGRRPRGKRALAEAPFDPGARVKLASPTNSSYILWHI